MFRHKWKANFGSPFRMFSLWKRPTRRWRHQASKLRGQRLEGHFGDRPISHLPVNRMRQVAGRVWHWGRHTRPQLRGSHAESRPAQPMSSPLTATTEISQCHRRWAISLAINLNELSISLNRVGLRRCTKEGRES